MITLCTIFIILISVLSGVSADDIDDIIYFTDSGYAEFTSSVPTHTFTGESRNLTGMIDPKDSTIDFYLDLNSIETGIGRRDRDMLRTLNVDEFPFAEFTGKLENGFDVQSSQKQKVVAVGEFTIHGVTREIEVEGFIQRNGDELHVEAAWILLLEDYDIEPPGILFYRVNEQQEVRIEATLEARNREEFSGN